MRIFLYPEVLPDFFAIAQAHNDSVSKNADTHDTHQKGTGQAWFPRSWTETDIRRAGEHVAGLKQNRHAKDGVSIFGTYKGVRVGVKKTNGIVGTVCPDSNQGPVLRRKKR